MGLGPLADWVLTDGRHVQRVGVGDPPDADRVVDLPGATIVPGFIDAHVHLTSTGMALANTDVATVRSASALLELARARAAEGAGVVWLQGFDESAWHDPRHPTLEDLDTVTSRPLVLFRADGHLALANTAAIEQAQLGSEPGIERDPEGRPTGRLTLRATQLVHAWAAEALDHRTIEELQLQAAGLASSRGVTAVHEMSMPHWYGMRDLDVLLGHRGLLPVDTTPIVATTDIPFVIAQGLTSIGGDLPTDGSIGARTAALTAPYRDRSDSGATVFDDDQLAGFFHDGHAAGLQVGVHAIGDRAIEQVLRTWERIYHALDSRERRHFRARRHRIEHVEMASSDQVERAAMLGLAASVQPVFDRAWGFPEGLYDLALGWSRAEGMNPFRSMIDRGVVVGVGSDAPVTPLDPWLAITAMEQHHHPAQRLTRPEAFRVHTVGSARLGHQEEKKGVLEPGKHADFAAYDVDPFDVSDVGGLRPILTVSLGRDVFST